ncbi:MAG: hypothetical protein SF069_05770 [Phycisphaerae bacterium]|nr:hypothetical protein [Phycisphaerae bacterium]
MANLADRFNRVRRLAMVGAVFMTFLGLAAATYGVIELGRAPAAQQMGIAFVIAGVACIGMAMLTYSLVVLAHKFVNNSYRMYDALLEMTQAMKRHSDWLHAISEHSSQSEWVKRIIYREKDYEFLRDTIQGMMVRQDWEAADHFIQEIEDEFGYHDEAAKLRAEVERVRSATTEEKVQNALVRFNKLCGERHWDRATREIERLQALFPGEARITSLPQELQKRRDLYKSALMKHYQEAVRIQDVDRAHDLLIELDQYLSPAEADGLRQSARGIFRAKLHQMGAQFNVAVSERNFEYAIDVGQQLVREFPNTRYAREIEDMLPKIQRLMGNGHAAESHAVASN